MKWTQVFVNEKHPKFFLINDFFALLTIISVVGIVLETVPSLSAYEQFFNIVEWVTVVFFSVEYLARLSATRPWHKYSFSFFGIIDLVSIVPSFFGFGNLTFLKAARALRIIRLLRLIRSSAMRSHAHEEDYNPVAFNVLIYFAALLFALLAFGTAMYVVEGGGQFESIPLSMWWAFKVFLGGISVEPPVTDTGEVFYVLTRFTGMLLLGLLLGVVGNIFRLVLGTEKK